MTGLAAAAANLIAAALWGAIAYATVRAVPHAAIAVTGWPLATDNQEAALAFAIGLTTGLWCRMQAVDNQRVGASADQASGSDR